MNEAGTAANLTRLTGALLELGPLRHTPAGIPAIDFRLGHQSEQIEAEAPRKVECQMPCVALGMPASLLASARVGVAVSVSGFLAAKSLRSPAPVLHVQRIEFVEGNENGFQTEI